ADAKQVVERAGAILKELEDTAATARKAVQAGDIEAASAALSKVLAINPNHPVAGELSAQLNRHFRGQAEDARKRMLASRAAADRAQAGTQAPFAEGAAAAREADRLFARDEFAVATRKFLESRDAYDRAVRAKEAQQAAAARTPPPTVPAGVSGPPAPPPATVAHPPTPAPAAASNEEAAIRKVVEAYGNAIQAKDLGLFRAVKPNLSPEEEKRLRAIFKEYKSYRVSITIKSLQV